MPDYDYQNGNVTMRIRDTGASVEFWVLADRSTYNHTQKWSYDVNGASPVLQFDMNGRGSWQHVGTAQPPSRMNVRFTLYDAGLGYPTYDFWHFIERAGAPDPPNAPHFGGDILQDSVHVAFEYAGDGGLPIDQAEIWYSDDANVPKWRIGNTRDAWVAGLRPRTWYFFWGRTHNPLGWSPFGARGQHLTAGPPDPPNLPIISAVTNNKIHVDFTFTGWDGGTPIQEWQIGYGTDPNFTQFYQSGVNIDIWGLQPNQTYFVWARGRNAFGWGPWSDRAQVRMFGPPAAPTSVDVWSPTSTSVQVSYGLNSDNGNPYIGSQIGYGKTPNGPDAYFSIAGTSGVVTGLQPGTLYYFWARASNAYGWSDISAIARTAQTTAGAWINVGGVWKQAVPFVNVNGVWKPAQAWAKIAGVWKETT